MKRFTTLFLLFCGFSLFAQTVPSQWNGRKVALLGDSITDPRQTQSQTVYWQDLQEMLGIQPLVYAVSGYQMSHVPQLFSKLQAEHGQDVDAIMIFLGTNDYNSSVPMGEWYTLKDSLVNVNGGMVRRMYREFSFNPDTFKGRINVALRLLKTAYTGKQIILLTPIHRAYACFGEKNVQPDENFANGQGLFVDAYVNAIKEAGNLWAVPVIDLNSLCGLHPVMKQYAPYFRKADTDMLHPNSEGHLVMSRTIACQMLGLPVF